MILLVVLSLLTAEAYSQECRFNISKTSPCIVDINYNFPSTFHFEFDDLLYIACPKGTFTEYLADEGEAVACKGDTKILLIRTVESLDFKDIVCKSNAITSVQNSNENCGKNGTLLEVGYKIYRGFVSTISICFNRIKLFPFYAKFNYTRTYDTIPNSVADLICPSQTDDCHFVDSGGLYPNINIDDLYLNQDKIFENLGVNVYDYLIKVPLALNDGQFLQEIQSYPYWDYTNVVPVWSSLIIFMDFFFGVFASFAISNIMYTGTLGVATLPNTEGNPIELYLYNNQIPVPEWIWAAVETDDGPSVGFMYNSFFDAENEYYDKICTNWYIGYLPHFVWCTIDSVIDLELNKLLADIFCKNGKCESRSYINVTDFRL